MAAKEKPWEELRRRLTKAEWKSKLGCEVNLQQTKRKRTDTSKESQVKEAKKKGTGGIAWFQTSEVVRGPFASFFSSLERSEGTTNDLRHLKISLQEAGLQGTLLYVREVGGLNPSPSPPPPHMLLLGTKLSFLVKDDSYYLFLWSYV